MTTHNHLDADVTLKVLSDAARPTRLHGTGFRFDAVRAIERTHRKRHWAWPEVVFVADATSAQQDITAVPVSKGFVIPPIQGSQQSRLTGTGWSQPGSDRTCGKLQAHPLKHGFRTETQGEVHSLHDPGSGIAIIFTFGFTRFVAEQDARLATKRGSASWLSGGASEFLTLTLQRGVR